MRTVSTLAELRRHLKRSQKSLSIPQPTVSRIEGRGPAHVRLSTLRGYLQALGAELELVVRVDGTRFRLDLDGQDQYE